MAGVEILKAGGNCVDAAIAVNAMLGLTEPQMNGIGGDLFAIFWSEEDRQLYGLNASGRAPRSWSLGKAQSRGLRRIPARGVLSWTVPGCVSGWEMLNARFGNRSLGECLEPAIRYAEEGFPLSPVIAQSFDFSGLGGVADDGFLRTYNPGGRVPKFGEVFRNPALARCYRLIAESGGRAFYEGEIAERIVSKSQELGGEMSLADLAGHVSDWIEPISTSYRGFDVWELPPNGQGLTVLQMLNLLEYFEFDSIAHNSAAHLHLLIEAKRLAYPDGARYFADPEFADVPIDWLVSKDYAAERVKLIDPLRAARGIEPGETGLNSDTIYMTAADANGNMISLIQSLYSEFGSRVCPDETGFAMQNRGSAFSLDPLHANRLEPGKRPFHTIIPAFVTESGNPRLSFGVMGGAFQPQGQCQVLMNMIDFGMSPQQAGDQPRMEHIQEPGQGNGVVVLENGIPETVQQALSEMGHQVGNPRSLAMGGYQGIWRSDDPRIYFGASDPRKDGAAIGY